MHKEVEADGVLNPGAVGGPRGPLKSRFPRQGGPQGQGQFRNA